MSTWIRFWPWSKKNQNPHVAKIANLGILSTAILNVKNCCDAFGHKSWIIDPQNPSVVLKFKSTFALNPLS